jgi:hypothetical protein
MAAEDIFAGSGQALSGPYGTTLPTDIDDMTTLDPALLDLGLISEDGLEHAFSVDKTVIRDWSGQPVRAIGTSTEITFKLTYLETNAEVIGHYYGADPVVAGTGSRVDFGQPSDRTYAMVIPVEDPGTGRVKVYVLPRVEVVERDDQTVKPDETGYGITYQALLEPTLGSCGYILFDEDLTGTLT